jgi:hypothetical protein
LAWIFGRRWELVWQGNWIVPLLGIIALPYTTIMYMLVWSPTGLHGFDWMWLFLGVLLDIMKWSQIARNREGIPGQGSNTQPATQATPAAQTEPASQTTAAAPADQPAAEVRSGQAELDKLADLHDQGILTDEEYQAKKAQIEGGE